MLKFELSMDMTNVVMEALGNAPYRIAAPVVATIQQQYAEQTKPKLVPANKPEDDKKETAS